LDRSGLGTRCSFFSFSFLLLRRQRRERVKYVYDVFTNKSKEKIRHFLSQKTQ
jgi:hypothetical protein